MDKANPLSTPMVIRSLSLEKDSFRPCEDEKEALGPEVPYLSAFGALMYLANYKPIGKTHLKLCMKTLERN